MRSKVSALDLHCEHRVHRIWGYFSTEGVLICLEIQL